MRQLAMPTTREQLEAALARLLTPEERERAERAGGLSAVADAAVARGLERRMTNSRDTGTVIEAYRTPGLVLEEPLTWRGIEERTGLPKDTAQRWAEPPGGRS